MKKGNTSTSRINNEVVFKHPIPFDQIEKVLVRPHHIASTRKLLDSFGYLKILVESLGDPPQNFQNVESFQSAKVNDELFIKLDHFFQAISDQLPESWVYNFIYTRADQADPSFKFQNLFLEITEQYPLPDLMDYLSNQLSKNCSKP